MIKYDQVPCVSIHKIKEMLGGKGKGNQHFLGSNYHIWKTQVQWNDPDLGRPAWIIRAKEKEIGGRDTWKGSLFIWWGRTEHLNHSEATSYFDSATKSLGCLAKTLEMKRLLGLHTLSLYILYIITSFET